MNDEKLPLFIDVTADGLTMEYPPEPEPEEEEGSEDADEPEAEAEAETSDATA